MHRVFDRSIVLLLVSCLIADPIAAADAFALDSVHPTRFLVSSNPFEEQALAEMELSSHHRIAETSQMPFGFAPVIAAQTRGNIIGRDVTEKEETAWRKNIAKGSNRARDKNRDVIELVESRAKRLLDQESKIREMLNQELLPLAEEGGDVHDPTGEIEEVLLALKRPRESFQWFKSKSYVIHDRKYLLGTERALAVDVIRYLQEQELQQGRNDLIDEYILHEAMERTSLGHRRIIQLTAQFFDRSNNPLGDVLRQFKEESVDAIPTPGSVPRGPRAQTDEEQKVEIFYSLDIRETFKDGLADDAIRALEIVQDMGQTQRLKSIGEIKTELRHFLLKPTEARLTLDRIIQAEFRKTSPLSKSEPPKKRRSTFPNKKVLRPPVAVVAVRSADPETDFQTLHAQWEAGYAIRVRHDHTDIGEGTVVNVLREMEDPKIEIERADGQKIKLNLKTAARFLTLYLPEPTAEGTPVIPPSTPEPETKAEQPSPSLASSAQPPTAREIITPEVPPEQSEAAEMQDGSSADKLDDDFELHTKEIHRIPPGEDSPRWEMVDHPDWLLVDGRLPLKWLTHTRFSYIKDPFARVAVILKTIQVFYRKLGWDARVIRIANKQASNRPLEPEVEKPKGPAFRPKDPAWIQFVAEGVRQFYESLDSLLLSPTVREIVQELRDELVVILIENPRVQERFRKIRKALENTNGQLNYDFRKELATIARWQVFLGVNGSSDAPHDVLRRAG